MRKLATFSLLLALAVVAALFLAVKPASAAPPATSHQQSGGVHVVRAGETLSGIASRYGVSATALARANGISNPNHIYVGQRLVIPGAGGSSGGSTGGGGAAGGGVHVVARGETLASIAARYGTTVSALARANGISNPSLIYVGQRLVISGAGGSAGSGASSGGATSGGSAGGGSSGGVHIVRAGESLGTIAARYGTTVNAIARANGIANPSLIYVGQRLAIPRGGSTGGGVASGGGAPGGGGAGRWIDINLSTQTLTAYEGGVPVFSSAISSGLRNTPTPVGTYRINWKLPSQRMTGPGYDLPNVPYVMYFTNRGHAIHGTYWHNNFGTPMSHGCVNLPTANAQWLYNFSPVGTQVVVHY